ncbi:unnamed protein product [Phytomonas sp. EM1]|nr:unnamed protein product [Phytomonas sp. EM1]|eukprot:CCW60107.1 unnamed protein product [Phytomonas sp. isolate EM1]
MSTSASKCPICAHTFSLILWKHTCQECKRTVCDNCAPKKVQPGGYSKKRRVCSECLDYTNALRAANSYSSKGVNDAVARNRRNDEQRERRAVRVGEGMHAMQIDDYHANSMAVSTLKDLPGKAQNREAAAEHSPKGSMNYLGTMEAHTTERKISNPVLEAALRRQNNNSHSNDADIANDKVRLINEIEMLCKSKGETTPFGLRASDEAKLRSYLKYLKEKYKARIGKNETEG